MLSSLFLLVLIDNDDCNSVGDDDDGRRCITPPIPVLVLLDDDDGNSLDDDDDPLQLIVTIIVSMDPILLPSQSIRFISFQSMRLQSMQLQSMRLQSILSLLLIRRDDNNNDGKWQWRSILILITSE